MTLNPKIALRLQFLTRVALNEEEAELHVN